VGSPPSSSNSPFAGLESGSRTIVSDHELLGVIGRGSYGEVWLARNVLRELRAVKLIYRSRFTDQRPFEREFEGIQRFEPISRSHPSQLAILHVGKNEEAGCFYYVMELADPLESPKSEFRNPKEARSPKSEITAPGSALRASAFGLPSDFGPRPSDLYLPHTLRHDLEHRGRLPIAECVQIGLSLTTAVAHLHQHGLVHRDIKPSNVIFVNGVPKLGDIGLVTEAGDTQSIVGTEGYLPPEGPGTPQADIFSLGKVLYEISSGQDRRRFPELPEDLRNWPDRSDVVEFNEIVLKACAKDPAQRYRSAEEVRRDLELLGGGGSIRRARQTQRSWRLARRAAGWLTVTGTAASLVTLASRLRLPPTALRLETRSTNELANQQFDLGRIFLDRGEGTNFQMAANCFERAIGADTNFAAAYAYLASTYCYSHDIWNPDWIFLPRAKEAALKALVLDRSLTAAHCALAWQKMLLEWDWHSAETEYIRALKLDPGDPFCHSGYAEFLKVVGRTNEAVEEMRTADRLAQNKFPWIKHRLCALLVAARRFDEALDQADFTIKVEPADYGHYAWRTRILCGLNRYAEALDSDRQLRLLNHEPQEEVRQDIALLKNALKAQGPKVYWRRELEGCKRDKQGPYFEALAQAQLGETNEAIRCLQTALKERNVWLTFRVMTDWELDPVRSDPRFHTILRTMHLE
jgi:tetratricopeptide (TPR) repeat protein